MGSRGTPTRTAHELDACLTSKGVTKSENGCLPAVPFPDSRGVVTQLSALLIRHRPALVRFLRREAAGLEPFESAEDLAQGACLEALRSAHRFQYAGEKAFRAWLRTIAKRHVARRAAHWRAKRRDASPMKP